jgi:Lrp/AsnC family transcriptional regulator, leucine-responsive regulatory protein
MVRLDEIDTAILVNLQQDSRIAYADLAQKVGLSVGAVHERVKKLERKGVIKRYRVDVDPEAIGLSLTAFVAVQLESNSSCRSLMPEFLKFSEIEEVHSVAGEIDVILKVHSTDTKTLEDLLYRIKAINGISRMTTRVVLSTELEGRPVVNAQKSVVSS